MRTIRLVNILLIILLLSNKINDYKITVLDKITIESRIQTLEIVSNCPNDMIYVHGLMVDGDSEYIEALQDNTCTDWINTSFPARCRVFSKETWKKVLYKLPKKEMEFCIDTYEYPNVYGSKPTVDVTWDEAKIICQNISKRLCNEDEWTFACEGEESLPYPYGYVRDSSICNIDKPWIEVNYLKINSQEEIDRLWQGVNSGKMENCISPFGVHDMTGNIDEWTVSNKSTGYPSILKGGYWSVVRNRCRPSTRFHNQWHHFYQQGFRCCADIYSQ